MDDKLRRVLGASASLGDPILWDEGPLAEGRLASLIRPQTSEARS